MIRRWHFREGLSAREIARRTKLSRNTVSKYLESGEIEPRYARRVSLSKLDAFAEQLRTWLADAARRDRKQRRTVKQMYRSLQLLGYSGSYDRVCVFARRWKQAQRELTLGKSGTLALRLTHVDLVILTTNLSFAEWTTVFGDQKMPPR